MKIFDAVHKFIHFSEVEARLIDSTPFQRLRYIHQLGVIYLVYPGATNKRFEHSLGTLNLATQIYDLVTQLEAISPQVAPYLAELETPEARAYWRQILRLSALCHDLGHLPFSHVAEEMLLPQHGHEEMTLRIIYSDELMEIWKGVNHPAGRNTAQDIAKLAVGYKKLQTLAPDLELTPCERVLSEIVTGDEFGADRIDYLLRDANCTGLAYGLIDYHQIIETLCFLPVPEEYAAAMGPIALGFNENGLQAVEALLMARYFMHSRVYQHPKTLVHSFHLKQFMFHHYQEQLPFQRLEVYLKTNDYEVLAALNRAATDPSNPVHEHARAIHQPRHRYRYLSLRQEENHNREEVEELLASIKEHLGEGFVYSANQLQQRSAEESETPVLCQLDDGRIFPAYRLSELYSQIPQRVVQPIVFVSAELEEEARELLGTSFGLLN